MQPAKQIGQALVDIIDVEGRDLQGRSALVLGSFESEVDFTPTSRTPPLLAQPLGCPAANDVQDNDISTATSVSTTKERGSTSHRNGMEAKASIANASAIQMGDRLPAPIDSAYRLN